MPELPEVEHLRRTLEPRLVGRDVVSARLVRPDVLTITDGCPRSRGTNLLVGGCIASVRRLGKQLAITSGDDRVLCVHLGMTGRVQMLAPNARLAAADHVHCRWKLDDGHTMVFRDPRRFGGLWAFPSTGRLQDERWRRLGPDALTITSAELAKRLRRTRRAVKAALLDQSVLAGVGNIYADEALFGSRLHPARRADGLARAEVRDLARELRRTLGRAVDSGGSSLRDYVDAEGRKGGYAAYHQVYGRGGEPCVRCSTRLERMQLAQRTTVFCPQCQQGRGRIEEGVPCEVQKHRP